MYALPKRNVLSWRQKDRKTSVSVNDRAATLDAGREFHVVRTTAKLRDGTRNAPSLWRKYRGTHWLAHGRQVDGHSAVQTCAQFTVDVDVDDVGYGVCV